MLEMFDDDLRDLKSDNKSDRDQSVDEESFDLSSLESDFYLSEILDDVYGYKPPVSDFDLQTNLANRTDPSGNPYPYPSDEKTNDAHQLSTVHNKSTSRISIFDFIESDTPRDFGSFYKNFDNTTEVLDVFDNGAFSLFTNKLDKIPSYIHLFSERNFNEYNELLSATTEIHSLTDKDIKFLQSDNLSFAVYVNAIEITTVDDFIVVSTLVSARKDFLSSLGLSTSQIKENMFSVFELERLDSFKVLAEKIVAIVDSHVSDYFPTF